MYTVLVVEDENIIRKGLISLIDFKKHKCMLIGEASNGKQGMEMIRKHKPDIVITDINMPYMDGLAMIEETITQNYTCIIISGYSDFRYAQKAVRFGVSDYVLKPVDAKELEEALLQAIAQRELMETYAKIKESKKDLIAINLLEIHIDSNILVDKMLGFVDEHYAKKITIEDLCKALNYSESLLSKRFKESVKLTFIEYLNRYRIQKSIDLLKEGKTQLVDIAEMVGFSEYKYYSVVFKKYMNCSPKQFLGVMHASKHMRSG
ncbi:MAG: response regulator [Breznakia sp.]